MCKGKEQCEYRYKAGDMVRTQNGRLWRVLKEEIHHQPDGADPFFYEVENPLSRERVLVYWKSLRLEEEG